MLNKIPSINRTYGVFFCFTIVKLCLNVIIILRLITITNLYLASMRNDGNSSPVKIKPLGITVDNDLLFVNESLNLEFIFHIS